MMKRYLLGFLVAAPLALATLPAAAAPPAHGLAVGESVLPRDLVQEIKGGRGGGRGHGYGRGGGHRAHGWSRGRKVGWRGRGCPPGLRIQGRC
jgi:hypothetical protein